MGSGPRAAATPGLRGAPSCAATPQHPSLMPAGHGLRGPRPCGAQGWGSHPEFGDWGTSEPQDPRILERLKALLKRETARQDAEKQARLADSPF